MNARRSVRIAATAIVCVLIALAEPQPAQLVPDTDWGHWRLGQRADTEFLARNHMTVTFGSGAPNFEAVTRQEFDQQMEKAKAANRSLHDQGYIVLRYLTSSLNGKTETSKDAPRKEQIELLKFWNERWTDFAGYIGPKPSEDPTHWITVRADGSFPHYRYAPYGKETTEGFETWGCPNNPDFVRMMEGRVRAQAETGIDGSYVDWTQIAGETCYCRYCRAKFPEYLKKTLPAQAARAKYGTDAYDAVALPKRRSDPFWMEWLLFRGQSVAEFHKRLSGAARQTNPHFMISGNVFGGFGYGPIAYDAAGNMEMLGAEGYDDFIYSEMQEYLDSAPRKNEQGTKITNSPALKFLAAVTHGKPVIIYATEITPPVFPNPTERCLSAMAQINIAEAVANRTVFREKRETPPGATELYSFLANNEHDLRDVRLASNVAVVASLRQYLAGELSFAFSLSRVFADRGVSHVFLTERDLGALSSFDVVVVPYLPLMAAEQQQQLLEYARSGGTLLILGESGAKDEHGVPQPKVALAQAFGGRYPATDTVRPLGRGRAIFVPLAIPESRFLVSMKSRGDYTTFGPTMADLFPDIPEAYTRNRMDPALRKILEQVSGTVESTLAARMTRLTKPLPYVEINTMLGRDNRRMLVHVVNYDVTVDGIITPAPKVDLQVTLPKGRTAASAKWSGTLSEMKDVNYRSTKSDGVQTLAFELGQVNVYGLLTIELK